MNPAACLFLEVCAPDPTRPGRTLVDEQGQPVDPWAGMNRREQRSRYLYATGDIKAACAAVAQAAPGSILTDCREYKHPRAFIVTRGDGCKVWIIGAGDFGDSIASVRSVVLWGLARWGDEIRQPPTGMGSFARKLAREIGMNVPSLARHEQRIACNLVRGRGRNEAAVLGYVCERITVEDASSHYPARYADPFPVAWSRWIDGTPPRDWFGWARADIPRAHFGPFMARGGSAYPAGGASVILTSARDAEARGIKASPIAGAALAIHEYGEVVSRDAIARAWGQRATERAMKVCLNAIWGGHAVGTMGKRREWALDANGWPVPGRKTIHHPISGPRNGLFAAWTLHRGRMALLDRIASEDAESILYMDTDGLHLRGWRPIIEATAPGEFSTKLRAEGGIYIAEKEYGHITEGGEVIHTSGARVMPFLENPRGLAGMLHTSSGRTFTTRGIRRIQDGSRTYMETQAPEAA